MSSPEASSTRTPSGPIRGPQSFYAGLVLLAFTLFVFWASKDLPGGTMKSMGPGMMPRILATGLGLCALALIIAGLRSVGAQLERWSIRGPVFVLAGVILFAFTIRSVGLALAGPLAMIVSGFASPETKTKEIVIFSLVMTAACVGLFWYALKLPIPILRIPGLFNI
ncbi:MAG: tripartite tricarboxylate transporter TctB family protein [Verrucomicrobia bacterium]|nr:tripartite tricarboxylate transporter TctB family protein [Verrucomicrobiota bacterium]